MDNMFSSGLIPSSPKQFDLVSITSVMASELNKKWHSRLPNIHWSNIVRNKHYACYGAYYDWNYFAVGIWSSPVARCFNGDDVLELRRLAISDKCPKYTATWMISKMIKDIKVRFPNIKTLISYQDTDVHLGTIYKASNWVIGGKTIGNREWSCDTRKRKETQTSANKIRWEYYL